MFSFSGVDIIYNSSQAIVCNAVPVNNEYFKPNYCTKIHEIVWYAQYVGYQYCVYRPTCNCYTIMMRIFFCTISSTVRFVYD